LKQSAGALQDLAAQPKYLGAELGPTAILQTWTRDLRYHPQVHLLVPGGGLTPNGLRWVRVKDGEFLVPQVKLAARFKGRLKAWLQQEQPELFQQVPAKVWWLKWVADVQAVGGGEAALKYLANYLCSPPLREHQIERDDATGVTFGYRANGGQSRRGTVSGEEFIRRVLQHVPPKGFQRVRHYGWRGGQGQVGTHPGLAGLASARPATRSWQLATSQMSGLWQDPVLDRDHAARADGTAMGGDRLSGRQSAMTSP
jgi:hypothetical protein